MARDPNIPDAFDVLTVVVLRRPDDAPDLTDEELDALQTRHLAYRAELHDQGLTVANGPFMNQTDESYRGMSVFACDRAEAARLSDADPSVVAGRLTYDVMSWWTAAGSVSFPVATAQVGERRSMPGD